MRVDCFRPSVIVFFQVHCIICHAMLRISYGRDWWWGWVALDPWTTVLKTKRMSTSYGIIGCYFFAWGHRKPSLGFHSLFFLFFFFFCNWWTISQPRGSSHSVTNHTAMHYHCAVISSESPVIIIQNTVPFFEQRNPLLTIRLQSGHNSTTTKFQVLLSI